MNTTSPQEKSLMKISELAKRADVNLQTVRYYESLGLLPEPVRNSSGYRLYDETYIEHIEFVKNAQDLEFTLDEIKDLVKLKSDEQAFGRAVKKVVREKISALEIKIDKLSKLKSRLEKLDSSCSGDMPTSSCPIIQTLYKGSCSS